MVVGGANFFLPVSAVGGATKKTTENYCRIRKLILTILKAFSWGARVCTSIRMNISIINSHDFCLLEPEYVIISLVSFYVIAWLVRRHVVSSFCLHEPRCWTCWAILSFKWSRLREFYVMAVVRVFFGWRHSLNVSCDDGFSWSYSALNVWVRVHFCFGVFLHAIITGSWLCLLLIMCERASVCTRAGSGYNHLCFIVLTFKIIKLHIWSLSL